MARSVTEAPNIQFTIPVGLTAAYITRINPEIGADGADRLAAEIHYIIYTYTSLFEARSPDSPGEHASDLVDATLTIWRTALGMWCADGDDGSAAESCWLMSRLTTVDPTEGLYRRWLRVSDRVCNDNLESLLEPEAD
jgi:hypothetical protein